MSGDLIVDDYQFEYGDTLFGSSTGHEVVKTTLLEEPDIRSRDSNRPQDHGAFTGRDYYAGKYFEIDIEIWGYTENELRERIDAFTSKFAARAGVSEFVIQVPGYGKLLTFAKPRGRRGPVIDKKFDLFVAELTQRMYAPDPRVYGADEKNASLTLTGVAQTGLQFPLQFDLSFGGISTPGSVIVLNEGTFESRPVISIPGPITNPGLENITADKFLQFIGTVDAGDFLLVDFGERSVLLNGTASRYSFVEDPSQWWALLQGNNVVRLTGSSTGSPTATITWRDARI